MEGCAEVRGGVRRCTEVCTEVCGGVHRGARRCAEVCGGVREGPRRGARRFFILSSYTHYSWLIVLDIQSFITICPWLPLVAPSNHWFSG